ncbi:MAG: hypothetical protein D6748_04140 [Calditrichaeota bacterium]|nr:MAG: hypothetical protein D6748_04140 [Calditrichota bacterium]
MNYQIKIFFGLVLAGLFFFWSCQSANSQQTKNEPFSSDEFGKYWYQGKAELNRYHLDQARYGEIHSGDAVLIFVTEDFWSDKQVKYEQGPKTDAVVSVLKLNSVRKFYTGVYPYSMMTSVFTPIGSPFPTLKLTNSSQEWCGHTYLQLNFRKSHYKGFLHSYFQEEVFEEYDLPEALLEDELWLKIRINPGRLPQGDIRIIPGAHYLRFRHQSPEVQSAKATLTTTLNTEFSRDSLYQYTVQYEDIKRSLTIYFTREAPYEIVGWEETHLSGFRNPRVLTTRAVRTHHLWLDYWRRNSVADSTYRKMLGL